MIKFEFELIVNGKRGNFVNKVWLEGTGLWWIDNGSDYQSFKSLKEVNDWILNMFDFYEFDEEYKVYEDLDF